MLRRVTSSYLLQFLVFVAILVLVVLMLARRSEGSTAQAQIVLFALAGGLALVGTVLLASAASGSASSASEPSDPVPPAEAGRTGAVLVGLAVVLLSVGGLVGLW
jgi:FtsH-binding integral membrane protein